jgi:hypothetical protein
MMGMISKSNFFQQGWKGIGLGSKHLRKMKKNEIIIEYDGVSNKRGTELSRKTQSKLNKDMINYSVYDHNGKSPHIHIIINGLETIEDEFRTEYKKRFVKKYSVSDNVDLSLCAKRKVIAKEEVLHYKKILGESGCENYTIKKKIAGNNEGMTNIVDNDLLNKIRIEKNKTFKSRTKLLNDLSGKDHILNYCLENQIPENSERNNILFRNLAVLLFHKYPNKIEEYSKQIVKNCEGKNISEFEGWLIKVEQENWNWDENRKAELNKWIDKYDFPIDKFILISNNPLLQGTKKPSGRLGQGIHNNKFYFGTSLNESSAIITSDKKLFSGITEYFFHCVGCNKEKKRATRRIEERVKKPSKCACGTNDWKLSKKENEIIDEFGLRYRTEFNDDAIDYFWNTYSIKKYLQNNYKKRDIGEIYQNIANINKKYIDHLNEESHKFIACWIIATYCFSLFEHFGRLYFRAEKGSGKTQQSRIIKFLSFNPMWITKGSESSIFRDAEATCGTFIVDNMDKLDEKLKRSIEHYIETGLMKDATYRLTNKDTHQTQKFQSYTPMALNNILGIDEDTIDKTFEIAMLKSTNNEIKRIKPTSKSEDWEKIRDQIRYWTLDNWKEIEKTYEGLSAKFSGREFDVVEGTLTIAKIIDKKIYSELCKYIEEKIEEQKPDLENNPTYIIFTEVWKRVLSKIKEKGLEAETEGVKIFVGDIAERVFPILRGWIKEEDRGKKLPQFSRYISKTIKSVPMFKKTGLSDGRTWILIKRNQLEQYMKLQQFFPKKEDDAK